MKEKIYIRWTLWMRGEWLGWRMFSKGWVGSLEINAASAGINLSDETEVIYHTEGK